MYAGAAGKPSTTELRCMARAVEHGSLSLLCLRICTGVMAVKSGQGHDFLLSGAIEFDGEINGCSFHFRNNFEMADPDTPTLKASHNHTAKPRQKPLGRRHQIRSHLAFKGHPVVHDAILGFCWEAFKECFEYICTQYILWYMTYLYQCICICICTCTCRCICVCVCICMCICMLMFSCMCTCVCIHVRIHCTYVRR